MPLTQPFDILLAHDRWATRQILNACALITKDQFHQRFDMGPGSLHDTTTHILGAIRGWTDNLLSGGHRPRLEREGGHSPADLLALLDPIADELAKVARSLPLDHTIVVVRGGQQVTIPRGVVITHVTTHGMHHRAQCLNMLRQLGVSPLPMSSVMEWLKSTGGV